MKLRALAVSLLVAAPLASAHAASAQMFSIDVSALPQGNVPAPLSLGEVREPVAEGAATVEGLSIEREGTSFFLVSDVTRPSSFQVRPMTAPTTRSSVDCSPRSKTPRFLVRWQTLRLAEAGQVTLRVQDGLVDPTTCTIAPLRSIDIQAAPIASHDGSPVAFAYRDGDVMVVLTPPTESVAGDASGGAVGFQRAGIPTVRLPLTRGGSSAVVLATDTVRAAGWRASLEAKKTTTRERTPMTVRIEASQAVSEDRPTVLVRVATQDR